MFWKRRTYLDVAAGRSGNASSPHEEGQRSREILEGARTDIARLLEVQSEDVIFTSGATEANALAVLGVARAAKKARGSIHVLYLPSAHASVVENMKLLAGEGVDVEEMPIKNYRVDTMALAKMLRKETILVSMDAVCGETGVIWNTREVKNVLEQYRKGIAKNESAPAARPIQLSFFATPLLHVDANQAPLTEKITCAHFGADLLAFDASKVCATRGIGALIAHRTISIAPLYKGGGQERGLRSGSEAPELARAFADGLSRAAEGQEAFRAAAFRGRVELIAFIRVAIPDVYINEGRAPAYAGRQAPHILNLSFPGRDTDYLVALLDEEGFGISTRSACETDSETGSRAVWALTGDRERARATLRISWGPETGLRELRRFIRALGEAVVFVDKGIAG